MAPPNYWSTVLTYWDHGNLTLRSVPLNCGKLRLVIAGERRSRRRVSHYSVKRRVSSRGCLGEYLRQEDDKMIKCEKCGKIENEVHVCNDNFGQFYICYDCATLKTIEEVARQVKLIRSKSLSV
jgi:hypothetical protein